MTEHASIRDLLSLAAAGVLDPDEQRRVQQHVLECHTCRRELELWQGYTLELGRLPAPVAPKYLAERTRALVLAERAAASERRWEDVVMAVLILLGWTVSLVVWVVFRLFTGGVLSVLQTSFVTLLMWLGVSTLFAWLTAAVAAVMLGGRRSVRRMV